MRTDCTIAAEERRGKSLRDADRRVVWCILLVGMEIPRGFIAGKVTCKRVGPGSWQRRSLSCEQAELRDVLESWFMLHATLGGTLSGGCHQSE
jgi:hypothetical protein